MDYREEAKRLIKNGHCEIAGSGRYALVLRSAYLVTIELFRSKKDAQEESFMFELGEADVYDLDTWKKVG